MEQTQIKKVNVLYLILYIFLPIVFTAVCFLLSILFFPKGTGAVILIMGPIMISFIWWVVGGKTIFSNTFKKFETELDQQGFVRNHTFRSNGCNVIVDVVNGGITVLFFWNPFDKYVLPASRITRIWVEDGKTGSGILEGSSRVSFLMEIDGRIKIRVNTFTSNKVWRMDSDYILTGISKADMMAQALQTAKNKSMGI